MTPYPIVIEFSDRVRALPMPTRTGLIVMSVAQFVFGAPMLALALVFVVLSPGIDAPLFEKIWGPLFLGTIGGFLCFAAYRQVRMLPRGGGDPQRPPYVFALVGPAIEFPAGPGRAAEVWPLERTRVDLRRGHFGPRITLSCPGYSRRRFAASTFRLPVETVARVIENQRLEDQRDPSGAI